MSRTAYAVLCMILATAPARADDRTAIIQFLADVTLIDRECPHTGTIFGVAFRYADGNGVPMLDVMPAGRRRPEFEAAMKLRADTVRRPELCGKFTEHYAHLVPGVFAPR